MSLLRVFLLMCNGRRVGRSALAGLLAACSLSALSGCSQGLGGGAKESPVVSVIPKADAGGSGPIGGDEGATVAGYGTFTGRFVLQGSPPALGPLVTNSQIKDADRASCSAEQIPNERLVVDASGGIRDVFIYLQRVPRGVDPQYMAVPEEPVIFDQEHCVFLPHALLMRAGQTILVRNSDGILHNTHTFPARNDTFNSGVRANENVGIPLVYAQGEREPVRVVCDIHAWMVAWHLPLDHPWGAVSAEDGSFTIENVPAGNHTFVVYHGGRKLMDVPVTIGVDETKDETINVPLSSMNLAGEGQFRTIILTYSP